MLVQESEHVVARFCTVMVHKTCMEGKFWIASDILWSTAHLILSFKLNWVSCKECSIGNFHTNIDKITFINRATFLTLSSISTLKCVPKKMQACQLFYWNYWEENEKEPWNLLVWKSCYYQCWAHAGDRAMVFLVLGIAVAELLLSHQNNIQS